MDDLLDTAPCGFLSFDEDGTVCAVNQTLLRMLSYERPDVEGKQVEALLTLPNRIFYQTHFFPLLKLHGKAEEIFLNLRARTGEDVPVLANAVYSEGADGPAYRCVFIPVHHRRKYEDEILAAKRTAERALQTNEALVAAKEELEHRTQDLDRKISRLEQKNDELTRLSSILSHDLREPVRKITMFVDILQRENRDLLTDHGREALDKVNDACARIDKLLRTLQQYISLDIGDESLSSVDLDDALDWALQQVQDRNDAPLSIYRQDLPTIEGYESQLKTMFFNLLDNALKFRKPDVAPEVSIECAVIQHNSYSAIRGKYRYIDYARITLSDNGIGFDQRYSEYVFGMLTKLNRQTPGLGYGLAICKKVVENHYGSLTVESRPGLGTKFTLLLPLAH